MPSWPPPRSSATTSGRRTFEGRVTAAAKGNHGGRPKVIDDDSLLPTHTLKDRGVPVPEIAKKLTVKTGKNAGQHLSVASVRTSDVGEASSSPCPPGMNP
ncbi:hypothetical protein [Streptomyces hirsutus]|uniref:hypothetical protein n=1 Tax=Streptomyces hirsutus TaxID=35620 RepID=UPI0036BCB1B7